MSVSGFLVSTALKTRVDGFTKAKEDFLEQKQVDGQMEATDFLDQNNKQQTQDENDLWNDDFFSNF